MENPQADLGALKAHLRVLNVYDLNIDLNDLEHDCTLGQDKILDAFLPDSDAPKHDPDVPKADLDVHKLDPNVPLP